MATLADSFLADFESSDDEDEVQDEQQKKTANEPSASSSAAAADAAAGGLGKSFRPAVSASMGASSSSSSDDVQVNEMNFDDDAEEGELKGADGEAGGASSSSSSKPTSASVATSGGKSVSPFLVSDRLQSHIRKLQTYLAEEAARKAAKQRKKEAQAGDDGVERNGSDSEEEEGKGGGKHGEKFVDKDEEYQLIVTSNEMCQEIDDEIGRLHKFVRDIYSAKYKELEEVVMSPIEYARCVRIIGNETDLSHLDAQLQGVVPPSVILTISVTASTTVGKPLPAEQLALAFEGCDAIAALDEHKKKVLQFIEAKMNIIAPNLCALIGPTIAAQLIGIAGGLSALVKIPACNLQLLGIKRRTLAGFSTATQNIHMGVLGSIDVVRAAPSHLRSKVLKQLAGKCTLAARMDLYGQKPSVSSDSDSESGSSGSGSGSGEGDGDDDDADAKVGEAGKGLLERAQYKIQKLQEPPPVKLRKALPKPNEKPRKRRGGKRYRKQRERLEVTEVQKAKNRIMFGQEEVTDEMTGEGMGLIGQMGTGILRIQEKDNQKLKNRLSRSMQARLHRIKGGAGTASVIAGAATGVPGAAGGAGAGAGAGMGAKGAGAGTEMSVSGTVTGLATVSGTATSVATSGFSSVFEGIKPVGMGAAAAVSAAGSHGKRKLEGGAAHNYFSQAGGFFNVKKASGGAGSAGAGAGAGNGEDAVKKARTGAPPPVPLFK